MCCTQRAGLLQVLLPAVHLVKGSAGCIGQARLLLEDPGCEGAILADWPGLLARSLASWGERAALLEAFSNGYRSACFLKDRVSSRPRLPFTFCPSTCHHTADACQPYCDSNMYMLQEKTLACKFTVKLIRKAFLANS
jgi:hypothetical protein